MAKWMLLILALSIPIVYFTFFWKVNWIRDLRKRGKGKKNRKIGDLPPVYPNGWFALLESSMLKKGEVKHVSALGENFAVFRSENGVAHILDAYCPHLGANLAEGGKVKGECLECPFHSWVFRPDGQCESIPYATRVPANARVKTWRCREVNHLVFVWYHAEKEEPLWQPEPKAEISNGTWNYHGRNEFLVNCHIQEIPENGADWAHLNAVHGSPSVSWDISWLAFHQWNAEWKSSTLSKTPTQEDDPETTTPSKTEATKTTKTTTTTMNEAKNQVGGEVKPHMATLRLHHTLLLFQRFKTLQLDIQADQIGPGYVELTMDTNVGRLFIIQAVTPVEPLLQRVTHMIFAPNFVALYAKLIFLGECFMFERDVAVWNHKKFVKNPILTRQDRSIRSYRDWYSQFYSTNSPNYHAALDTLQW